MRAQTHNIKTQRVFFILKACQPKHTLNAMYILRPIGTNRTDRTNGQVECTPTEPEDNGNTLSSYTPTDNEMYFTNGIPIE